MTSSLSTEEIARRVASQYSGVDSRRVMELLGGAQSAVMDRIAAEPSTVAVTITRLDFPIRIVLPWSALCSDNEHEVGAIVMRGGKPYPRKKLTARYKAARDKTEDIARQVMAGFAPLAQPLALHAKVYVPDEHTRDVCNFAKCCHDAFERIVYTNDAWLYDTRWTRFGVDVDRPRAEITVSPL